MNTTYLTFNIFDNPLTISIVDATVYNPDLNINNLCSDLYVVTPGGITKNMTYQKQKVTNISTIELFGYLNMTDLDDGVYMLKFSTSPSTLSKTIYHLRTFNLENRIYELSQEEVSKRNEEKSLELLHYLLQIKLAKWFYINGENEKGEVLYNAIVKNVTNLEKSYGLF